MRTEILKIVFLENEKSHIKKILFILFIFLFSHIRIYSSLFKFDFFNFDIPTYVLSQTLIFLLYHNI